MRVNPNMSDYVNAGISTTSQALDKAVQQLSSGLSVAAPSDNPYAAAANTLSLQSSSNVDRYTKNADAVLGQVQMADSTLSSVVSELTRAVSLGTQGADGSMNASDRAAVVTQLQAVMQQVVSLANTKYNGSNLFAGTSTAASAFVADPASSTGYSYQGNSGVNKTPVGDGLSVAINVPGNQIFTNSSGNALASLSQLITAVGSGDTSGAASALSGVNAAIRQVSQQRAVYAGTTTQINAQESYLSQESISLTSQQQALTGVDTTSAIQAMTQAQTAHTALLAAAAKLLPTSLLNYLSPQ